MNSSKTFCQTLIDTIKKCCCCHKCCDDMRKAWERGYLAMHAFWCFRWAMNTGKPCETELAKKYCDHTRSSVHIHKIIWTARPIHTMCIFMHSRHVLQQWHFFRASIVVRQMAFLEFMDSQLQTAARLAYYRYQLYFHFRLGITLHFSFLVWVCESMSPVRILH